MKIKIALVALSIFAFTFTGFAQTKKSSNAHREAHKAQLANHKSRLDNSVISDIIKNDVKGREQSVSGLSAESNKLITDLLAEAHRHIGKRYVHGAKGPNQFDCSGFSSYVYKQFGYNISPASRLQYNDGVAVSRNDLRKGDLVFFTSRNSGKNVGHVGIVVSADNEKGTFSFIHASIRGVKVSNFEGYYLNRYVGARRIVTN
ncbi:MAG: C40 family peptidase [Muribaculaceae bacterium]|nr:C40 family peptidase [Muribaculaceae bacterium]